MSDTESLKESAISGSVLNDGLGREYKCDCCGGIFRAAWTNEDALKEKESNGWSDMNKDDMAEVCHDCYIEIMAFAEKYPLS
jgi:hypothetical protein